MANIPTVLVFHRTKQPPIKGRFIADWEANTFNVIYKTEDTDLGAVLGEVNPHVILSFEGEDKEWEGLYNLPYYVRKKWIHINIEPNEEHLADIAYNCFISNSLDNTRISGRPKITLFTATYNTEPYQIQRLYKSLLQQTYNDWEWSIYDDSLYPSLYHELHSISKSDYRVNVIRGTHKSGTIGYNKKIAALSGSGDILAEIDHDDELLPHCLELLAIAYNKYPDSGFYSTDSCEIHENMTPIIYPEGFAMGYGSYRQEYYNGNLLHVCEQVPLNPLTIRHIVGIPNHIRAWKASFYKELGGHNPNLYVADDYEIFVRTFLNTIPVYIKSLGYLQWYKVDRMSNAQDIRRSEIQRLVRYIQGFYEPRIHQRFIDLGYDDWYYNQAEKKEFHVNHWL